MSNDSFIRYKKLKSSMEYWLLGRGYTTALKAMHFGLQHHIGVRKDGITPEFQHQIEQALKARTLIDSFLYKEETIATIFLHDTVEDKGGSDNKRVKLSTIKELFGNQISNAVWLMTNQYPNGSKKEKQFYYDSMASCEIASLCKGFDRDHNQNSMHGVFNIEKKKSYIEETTNYILPMMKSARKAFPEQEAAYQNIKWSLLTQIRIVEFLSRQDISHE